MMQVQRCEAIHKLHPFWQGFVGNSPELFGLYSDAIRALEESNNKVTIFWTADYFSDGEFVITPVSDMIFHLKTSQNKQELIDIANEMGWEVVDG